MKKWKMLIMFAVTLVVGILMGSLVTLLGIRLLLMDDEDLTSVGQTSYRVVVPARPDASGRVYRLGYDNRYLLVLTSKSSEYPEPYYMDLVSRRIGLPDVGEPRHIPLLGYALVDANVYHGFPLEGALTADWKVTSDQKEVRIRITGFEQEEPGDPDATMKEHVPMAYGNEIVLTRG